MLQLGNLSNELWLLFGVRKVLGVRVQHNLYKLRAVISYDYFTEVLIEALLDLLLVEMTQG